MCWPPRELAARRPHSRAWTETGDSSSEPVCVCDPGECPRRQPGDLCSSEAHGQPQKQTHSTLSEPTAFPSLSLPPLALLAPLHPPACCLHPGAVNMARCFPGLLSRIVLLSGLALVGLLVTGGALFSIPMRQVSCCCCCLQADGGLFFPLRDCWVRMPASRRAELTPKPSVCTIGTPQTAGARPTTFTTTPGPWMIVAAGGKWLAGQQAAGSSSGAGLTASAAYGGAPWR